MEGSNKKMADGNNGGEIMTADKRNQKTEAWRKENAIFFLDNSGRTQRKGAKRMWQ